MRPPPGAELKKADIEPADVTIHRSSDASHVAALKHPASECERACLCSQCSYACLRSRVMSVVLTSLHCYVCVPSASGPLQAWRGSVGLSIRSFSRRSSRTHPVDLDVAATGKPAGHSARDPARWRKRKRSDCTLAFSRLFLCNSASAACCFVVLWLHTLSLFCVKSLTRLVAYVCRRNNVFFVKLYACGLRRK